MKRIKQWFQGKAAKVGMVLGSAAVALAGSACAAEADTTASGTQAVISSMQTGMQGFASDALSMIGIIVPIAIGVSGTIWLARKAMGWFKSMAK